MGLALISPSLFCHVFVFELSMTDLIWTSFTPVLLGTFEEDVKTFHLYAVCGFECADILDMNMVEGLQWHCELKLMLVRHVNLIVALQPPHAAPLKQKGADVGFYLI